MHPIKALVLKFLALTLVVLFFVGLYHYLSRVQEEPEAIPPQVPSEEPANLTPETCQNECPKLGTKECFGSGYRFCGNYDDDSCLEWGEVATCPSGTTCQDGRCVKMLLKGTECNVNYEEAPEMASFASTVMDLCNQDYPIVKRELDDTASQTKLLIIIRPQANPAETVGSTIYLSSEWFTNNPDDLGAIVHEMAHVAQHYPTYVMWITEGMADYVRSGIGYNSGLNFLHCGNDGFPNYKSGYRCAGAFLKFVKNNYDKDIIHELNAALRANNYDDSLFKTYTGKDITELWAECRNSDCAGGSP